MFLREVKSFGQQLLDLTRTSLSSLEDSYDGFHNISAQGIGGCPILGDYMFAVCHGLIREICILGALARPGSIAMCSIHRCSEYQDRVQTPRVHREICYRGDQTHIVQRVWLMAIFAV